MIGRTPSRPMYLVISDVFTLSSCCGRLRLHISSHTSSRFLFCEHNRYRNSYLQVLSIYIFCTFFHLESTALKLCLIVVLCLFFQPLHILLCRYYFQRNFWHLLSIYQELTIVSVWFGTNHTPFSNSEFSFKCRLFPTVPISCEKLRLFNKSFSPSRK